MAKLLQGYTHLINPINLIPNSDFSQNGGGGLLTEPVHYDLMDSSVMNISTSPYCCYRFKIIAFQTVLSNVNIVRSRNSLRVSGYFVKKSASATVRWGLRIFPDGYIAQMNKTYTFIIKSVKNNNTTKRIHIRPVLVAQADVYYENESEGILIFRQAYTQDYMIAANVIMDDLQEGDFFDFTITGMYLYEGAYINPPLVSSLDVKPDEGDIFLHKDGMNYTQIVSSGFSSSNNEYATFIDLGVLSSTIAYGEFLLSKSWNNAQPQIFNIKFAVSNGNKYYLKASVFCQDANDSPTKYVKKFNIVRKGGHSYIGMQCAAMLNNYWSFIPYGITSFYKTTVSGIRGIMPFTTSNFRFNFQKVTLADYTELITAVPTEGF